VRAESFDLADLAKSDIDKVAEIHLANSLEYLERLAYKLYRRNPGELRKCGASRVDEAVSRVFAGNAVVLDHPQLRGRRSIAAMRLAFEAAYEGDRVLALVAGLAGMLMEAYGGDAEVWFTEELDPQRLYHAARNIEIAVWKLSNDRDPGGRLFLVSNEVGGPVRNLSFERLFGKLIALQDNMAEVVADASNRRIRFLVRTVASMAFIPL
jgi:hypothetical protein